MSELEAIKKTLDNIEKSNTRIKALLEDDPTTNRVGVIHEQALQREDIEIIKSDIKLIKESKNNATKIWVAVVSAVGLAIAGVIAWFTKGS